MLDFLSEIQYNSHRVNIERQFVTILSINKTRECMYNNKKYAIS